jgi:hypothetical protein
MIRSNITRKTPIKPSTKRKKASRPKMSKARISARGKPCMVRLPGCDGGGETTVLAHYRLAGYCGTGMKPPDEMGAWACAHCHDICDGRMQTQLSSIYIHLAHAEGVMRTQQAMKDNQS